MSIVVSLTCTAENLLSFYCSGEKLGGILLARTQAKDYLIF